MLVVAAAVTADAGVAAWAAAGADEADDEEVVVDSHGTQEGGRETRPSAGKATTNTHPELASCCKDRNRHVADDDTTWEEDEDEDERGTDMADMPKKQARAEELRL
jgi:hypothetical protein